MFVLVNVGIYYGDSEEIAFKTKAEMMNFLGEWEIELDELEEVGEHIYKIPDELKPF